MRLLIRHINLFLPSAFLVQQAKIVKRSRQAHATTKVVDKSCDPHGDRVTEDQGDIVPGPSTWPVVYGDVLYRFAISRLHDPHAAEEVVQDTLLGGLQSLDQFKGQAPVLNWLLAILRNKIADYWRVQARHRRDKLEDPRPGGDITDCVTAWSTTPADEVEWEEFWAIVHRSLSLLPAGLASAFRLSVIECLDSPAICAELGITSDNLWVRIHRAKKQLSQNVREQWCCET